MIGETVSHYRVLHMLGGGGMGIVYEAEDTRLRRRVALKFLPEDAIASADRLARFRREAEAASALNHPHICTIYDVGEHAGRPFLVMEKLEGHTLAHILRDGPQPLDRVLEYGADLSDALAAAHAAGIIHRDIKPANIFVTPRGVKLLDFGLARLAPDEPRGDGSEMPTVESPTDLTVPGTTLGTLAYMSPEQARGERVDARSDLFSLGVVLYEMVTGRPLFRGATSVAVAEALLHHTPAPPSQVTPRLHPAIDPVILGALEKDRELRVQSASELRAQLLRLRQASASGQQGRALPLRSRALLEYSAMGMGAMAMIAVVVLATRERPREAVTGQAPPAAVAPASPSTAQDAYLRGRYFAQRGETSDPRAIAAYEEAVRLDPKFAPAWADLARAYADRVYFTGDEAAEEKAFVAVEKALALDPDRAEVYAARGDLLWTQKNGFPHREALRDYRRAIELNPRLADAHASAARVLTHVGLRDEATRTLSRAIELQPGNLAFRFASAWSLVQEGRCHDAIAEFERLPPMAADEAARILALDCVGRTEQATRAAEEFLRDNRDPRWMSMVWAALALLRAKAGDAKGTEDAIRQAVATGTQASHFHHTSYLIASAYAVLDRRDAAIDWLERAAREGLPDVHSFVNDPNLAALQREPRFQSLVKRLTEQSQELAAIMR